MGRRPRSFSMTMAATALEKEPAPPKRSFVSGSVPSRLTRTSSE
jgi:hypothetical protein